MEHFSAVTGGISHVLCLCWLSAPILSLAPGQQCRKNARPPIFHLGFRVRDRLCIIAAAIQMYQVVKAQRGRLPDHYFPLGCQQNTSFSTIEYFDGYVQVGQAAIQ